MITCTFNHEEITFLEERVFKRMISNRTDELWRSVNAPQYQAGIEGVKEELALIHKIRRKVVGE